MPEWKDHANGQYTFNAPCGSLLRVKGPEWDLTLPSGKHVRGNGANADQAKADCWTAYREFALSCWLRGRTRAGGFMQCPTR